MKKLWQKMLNIKASKGKVLSQEVTHADMKNAYNVRHAEIESLRKYDRGEKTITPSNLENVVRGL